MESKNYGLKPINKEMNKDYFKHLYGEAKTCCHRKHQPTSPQEIVQMTFTKKKLEMS